MGLALAAGVMTAMAIFVYTGQASSYRVIGQIFNRVAAESNVRKSLSIAYRAGSRGKLDVYSPGRKLKGSAALAAASVDASPIILFFYGGSWQQGDRDMYRFVGTSLAKRGITVVIPDYRLYPKVQFPQFMSDAADAYLWTWLNLAKRSNGKHRPIIVMGHSAGANMAALLTLDPSYLATSNAALAAADQPLPPPAGLIGLAGPYAFHPLATASVKAVFQDLKDQDKARPIAFAKYPAPSTLLVHGTGDETVKLSNTRDFAAALVANQHKVQVEELPDIGHMGLVTAIAKPLRWRAPVLDRVVGFMVHNGFLQASKSAAPVASSAEK
jgi:acetyl esterase/lipase